MAPTIADIVKPNPSDEQEAEYISRARYPTNLKIFDYDPTWPQTFTTLKTEILAALGPTALSVEHVGSTSVPGLPAKNPVDIDVIVPDTSDEAAYVPALEAVGFHFILREPHWGGHRYFRLYEPAAAVHVWGPDSVEPVRHCIFRDWLKGHPDDVQLYAETKKLASSESSKAGENVRQYNNRKQGVILEILDRAFRSLGYIE